MARILKSYGLATIRYPILEITATIQPFDNRREFSLRVLSAGKPREVTKRPLCSAVERGLEQAGADGRIRGGHAGGPDQ